MIIYAILEAKTNVLDFGFRVTRQTTAMDEAVRMVLVCLEAPAS
jgi:hypothetical protein